MAIQKRRVWKVALYVRLSKEDGNDESLSVGNQRKILMEYVDQFEEEHEIADVYVDDGKSGTDVNRPDFMRMERDIRNGDVNCVIVKSLARAFRNLGDQQKYLEEFFPLHGVRFINLGTPFIDTYSNPRSASGLDVPIYGMFNEQFAAGTSEEVRKTFNTKRRVGEFIGAFAPYGYRKHPDNKNRLIVDEEAAQIVQDIFRWYLYGMERTESKKGLSINGIAKELNERGVPCPARYKKQKGFRYFNPQNRYKECFWASTSVSRILKDRTYTGCMVQGKFRVISYKIHKQVKTPREEWFVVENMHEPIVDRDVFDEVQRRLERNTRTPPGQTRVYMTSGFLRCADCERSLHRKTSKNLCYYYCRTPQLSQRACQKRSVRDDAIEKILLRSINVQLALIDNPARIIVGVNKTPKKSNPANRLRALRKRHQDEIARLTKTSDALYSDWKNGDLTREEYLRLKADFAARIDEATKAVAKIQEDEFSAGADAENPFFTSFAKNGQMDALRRDILMDFVDSVFLHKNGELRIMFKFADQVALIR